LKDKHHLEMLHSCNSQQCRIAYMQSLWTVYDGTTMPFWGLNVEAFHFAPESCGVNAHLSGGELPPPVVFPQDLINEIFFQGFK
jgi:hypothetical protein